MRKSGTIRHNGHALLNGGAAKVGLSRPLRRRGVRLEPLAGFVTKPCGRSLHGGCYSLKCSCDCHNRYEPQRVARTTTEEEA